MCAENIEEGNNVTLEQVLTTPSMRNRRPLKQIYAVAGKQQCPKLQEKADHHPLDLTDYSTTIHRVMK